MGIVKRAGTAGLIAALALAAVTGAAAANTRLRFAPAGAISATNENTIEISVLGGAIYRCTTATMTGEVVTQTTKIMRLPEGKIGSFDGGTMTACRTGATNVTAVVLMERNAPSNLLYRSFLGALPDIDGVLTIALSFRFSVRIGLMTCLYQGELWVLWTFPPSEEGGGTRFTRFTYLTNPRLRSTDCMNEVTVAGSFRATPAQIATLM